ncbi:MAG: metal-dependent transcriptional regulator [Thaumarchaeota archaeon]|nr:metal-dependent transcriptional regulator [Candidatus Calditenuaceae archaeon]MDW8186529.1 metal-dependent transcriptional regulator [Nitrososphaerota archaeon]
MPKSRGLTPAQDRYLAIIYSFDEQKRDITTGGLAKALGVTPASVSEALKFLESKKLVERRSWGKYALSQRGREIASRMSHNHRVLETYFVSVLGLNEGAACEEASKIDMLVGDGLVASMCRALSWPSVCVHGRPIHHGSCRGCER